MYKRLFSRVILLHVLAFLHTGFGGIALDCCILFELFGMLCGTHIVTSAVQVAQSLTPPDRILSRSLEAFVQDMGNLP